MRTALEAFKPALAADYDAFVRRRIAYFIEKFGPALRGIANSYEYKGWQAVAFATRRSGVGSTRDAIEINDAYLAKMAAEYAEQVVDAWTAKIEAKLGELENADVRHMDGARFVITGSKAGRAVRIEQDRIVNVSSKGTLFNQYPARIYVDGKFTSAAAFAKL